MGSLKLASSLRVGNIGCKGSKQLCTERWRDIGGRMVLSEPYGGSSAGRGSEFADGAISSSLIREKFMS